MSTPQARGAQTKRDRTVSKLLEAATFQLQENPHASADVIAADAGVSPATFYSYYETRAKLVGIVFRQQIVSPVIGHTYRPSSKKDADIAVDEYLSLLSRVIRGIHGATMVGDNTNIVRAALFTRYDDMIPPFSASTAMTTSAWPGIYELAQNLGTAAYAWHKSEESTLEGANRPVFDCARALTVGMLELACYDEQFNFDRFVPMIMQLREVGKIAYELQQKNENPSGK